ncbi:anti-sigma F factor [Fervidibacillus halotolerans]|uniref:Anti-sigma F factor n=1 Tax=Fervidibacillus halotolerans TaxID=2980027 RepID=A0A9E8RZD7_9BACI|nr:anti-sigma F factor [Fervidibacillus halotolerans]WAA13816.1 anti-sigma F factor [Fervidibacillus halotolerans]
MKNEMQLQFLAVSQNESFARVAVAAFVAQLDPTLDEITEIKTVVSEAVTNAIIHGYENQGEGIISVKVKIEGSVVEMEIRDQGVGIPDIEEAKQPLFTTKPELERSGMGFTIMENFTDEMTIESKPKEGTVVKLKKRLSKTKAPCN